MGKKVLSKHRHFKGITLSTEAELELTEFIKTMNVEKRVELKQLAKWVKYGIDDIHGALLRHRSWKGDTKSHAYYEYVYGKELAVCVINDVYAKFLVSKTGGETEPLRQLLSLPMFRRAGILFNDLTSEQIAHLTKVLDSDKNRYPKSWKELLVNFISRGLRFYHNRMIRMAKLKGKTTLLYLYLLKGKHTALQDYTKANDIKTKHFKSRVDYWLEQGLSLEQAKMEVSNFQKISAEASAKITRGTSEYSIRSVAYWIKKGLSSEDAKARVKQIQTISWTRLTDSERTERISRWIKTMDSKTTEEKNLLNFKKGHSAEAYMASRNISYEDALELSIAHYAKRSRYSGVSQELFWKVSELLGESYLYFAALNYEYQIGGKCIDFFDGKSYTLVEFNGDYWHCNPATYRPDFVRYGKTACEVWEHDKKRQDMIKSVLPECEIVNVWESDYLRSPDKVVNLICEIIQTRRKKYDK